MGLRLLGDLKILLTSTTYEHGPCFKVNYLSSSVWVCEYAWSQPSIHYSFAARLLKFLLRFRDPAPFYTAEGKEMIKNSLNSVMEEVQSLSQCGYVLFIPFNSLQNLKNTKFTAPADKNCFGPVMDQNHTRFASLIYEMND